MISIGELARRAQCTVSTIRYYESVGLLPEAQRREGGHRAYNRTDLGRLILIRRCRDFDMPLENIKKLLSMEASGKPCQETADFFMSQREAIKTRVEALQELDFTLSLYLKNCQSECMQNGSPCQIYGEMSQQVSSI